MFGKKRKIWSFVLVFVITLMAMVPIASADTPDYSYIRVYLRTMGTPTTVTFVVNGSYYIEEAPGLVLTRGTTYALSVNNGQLQLSYGGQNVTLGSSASLIRCASENEVNWLTVNNSGLGGWKNYPGDMRFTYTSGYIKSVCTLFIETYLVGVVAYEMSNSWPAEALKAQAVAARTYAMTKITTSGSYDVDDTTQYQVFKGYDPTLTNVIAAVNATRGQVLKWGNSLADGVYSASNGGQTLPNSLKWGADTYHTMKDDPYDLANSSSPRFTFSFYRTEGDGGSTDARLKAMLLAQVSAALAGQGISATDVQLLGVSAVQPHTLAAGHPANSRYFTKVAVTANVLVTAEGVEPTAAPEATAAPSGGGGHPGTATMQVTVDLATEDMKDAFAADSSLLQYHYLYYVEDSADGKAINLVARKYGHGVGMSQRGAQNMADRGAPYCIPVGEQKVLSFDELNPAILNFYYTGCTLYDMPITEKTLSTLSDRGEGRRVYGVVKASALNVRSGPGTNYGVVTTVRRDQQVEVLELGTSWYQILTQTGVVGYVSATYIEITLVDEPEAAATPTPTPTPTPEAAATPTPAPVVEATATPAPATGTAGTVKTSGSSLSLRTGAGTGYPRMNLIPNGSAVTILEDAASGWYKVTWNGQTGYCSSQYVQTAGTGDGGGGGTTTTTTTTGTVTAALNVRTGPGTGYSRIGTLGKGSTISILASSSGWYQIQYGGQTGYVSASYVKTGGSTTATNTTSSATGRTGTVTVSALNVRSGPSSSYKLVGTLRKNATVTVLDTSRGYYKISYNGGTAYAYGQYIRLS